MSFSYWSRHKFSTLRICLLVWALITGLSLILQFFNGHLAVKSLYFPITSFSVIIVLALFGYSRQVLSSFAWYLLVCLSVLGVFLCLDIDSKSRDYFHAISFACGTFAFLGLGVYSALIIHNKVLALLIRTFTYLSAIVLLLLPLSIWDYYLALGELLTSDIILAFAQTNADESYEYVISHANVYWLIALIVTILALSAMLISLHKITQLKIFARKYAFLYVAFLVIAQMYAVVPHIDYFSTTVLKVTGNQLEAFTLFKEAALKRRSRLAQLDSIKVDPKAFGLHVLVLGESHCRDRMQVYGYGRKNTPKLVEMQSKAQALIFDKAYASFPQTVPALAYALTEQNQYQHKDLEDAYSLLELANISGYETYWLSNQRKYGIYETPTSVIFSAADHEEWINGTSRMQGFFYDDELLNRLPDLSHKDKVLVVLHLMGSHQKYSDRSPDEFKIFLSQDRDLDDYDASILFVDSFLEKLYTKMSAYPNFQSLTFISDHGEELSQGIYDHNPTKFTFPMVRIPLVICLSDKFKQTRPEIYDNLKAHRQSVWTNDLTFNLLNSFLGIHGLEGERADLDLSSKQYRLTPKKALTLYGKKAILEDENFENQHKLRP